MEILAILAILIFLAGSYFMGNYFLDTFDETIGNRLVSSLYGVICWFVIAVIVAICIAIYVCVTQGFNEFKYM